MTCNLFEKLDMVEYNIRQNYCIWLIKRYKMEVNRKQMETFFFNCFVPQKVTHFTFVFDNFLYIFYLPIHLKYMLNICCKQRSSVKYMFETENIYSFNVDIPKNISKCISGQENTFPSNSSLHCDGTCLIIYVLLYCNFFL